MKRSIQACKYIVSDFVASSVVWLLFNLIRYQEIAVYEGFGDAWSFLTHSTSLWGQFVVPCFRLLQQALWQIAHYGVVLHLCDRLSRGGRAFLPIDLE